MGKVRFYLFFLVFLISQFHSFLINDFHSQYKSWKYAVVLHLGIYEIRQTRVSGRIYFRTFACLHVVDTLIKCSKSLRSTHFTAISSTKYFFKNCTFLFYHCKMRGQYFMPYTTSFLHSTFVRMKWVLNYTVGLDAWNQIFGYLLDSVEKWV